MEIDITALLTNENEPDISEITGSVAQLGNDAASITWNKAKELANRFKLSSEEKQACRDYFRTFGAWSKEELTEMSDQEITALFLQHVSLEYKENPEDGRIFNSDDRFYIYIGE